LINPVGDLKAFAIFKGKMYCPAHHPHDNTYVLLQERKPVRLWTGFGTLYFAVQRPFFNSHSYFVPQYP
jgi:hypothetical protein